MRANLIVEWRVATVVLSCLWAVTASAGDVFAVKTNYYLITGSTMSELRQSIGQSRPWKEKQPTDARTDWSIKWDFKHAFTDGAHRLASLEIQTTIIFTLPKWTPGPAAPEELSGNWSRYAVALKAHEDGHARLAAAAAAEIRQRATAIKGAPTAEALEKAINDAANQAVNEFRVKEADYDKATRHGATQGAHFP